MPQNHFILYKKSLLAMNRLRWLASVLIITALAGCSSVPEREAPKAVYVTGAKSDLDNTALVKESLYAQYSQWKNTKYQLGGLSKNGIDCSGLVHVTFKTRLGIVLPRSTEFQSELGQDVDKSQLRAGDLVFFKTGIVVRHVGVYLEEGRFLHASTKQGVTISRLSETYWKSAYWKAKRLDI
ncbi:glycoside hydrolase [Nitrosospira lacus]|uniref:Glycoside hydrolase n=1 Tax=Nitrosospira lacus TaxID=1288494 RepID=A0A1W6SQW9_9PROT|nr:NlpC/P60 family protein [Nitrosospira lacus]ARO88228.1 glycoside hydrolase [Nitrosospira lacus]